MNKKVVTLGEIMLRLSTNQERFIQANSFNIIYGGGEANVAVSLANYGYDSYFVSKLPNNDIGQSAINELRKYGVNTKYIIRGGNRIGIYFSETGASMRPSKIIYDRSHSSISEAKLNEFDFDKIFSDASWFHISGITPALSNDAKEITINAAKKAKEFGAMVSVDLNYRKKLWTPKEAQKTMTKLMEYVDICIGNEEDAQFCLNFHPNDTDVMSAKLDIKGYEIMMKQMIEKFGFKYVVSSLRESYSASDNKWSACISDGKNFFRSKKYDIRIVDRVGSGDSFAAALICAFLDGKNMKDAVEFAVSASALKHTIHGDFNLVTREEIEALVSGDSSGRVQR